VFNVLWNAITREKAPYVLTLFFAALGWTISKTSDRLVDRPVVEFSVSQSVEMNTNSNLHVLRLRNIGALEPIPCLKAFLFAYSPNGERVAFTSAQPMVTIRSLMPPETSAVVKEGAGIIVLQAFMPRGDVEATFKSAQPVDTQFQAKLCSGVDAGVTPDIQKSRVVLLPKSLESLLIEHELRIQWALISAWGLFMLAIGVTQNRTSDKSTHVHKMEQGDEDIRG
jgi:hypothetical protein